MTMALPPFVAQLQARYKALPRQQQLGIIFGIPLALSATFGYLLWNSLAELGPDQSVPELLRRPNGVWSEITALDEQISAQQVIIDEMPKIRKRIEELQDDIGAAEERLPREAEKASMREVFERLAREIPSDVGTVQIKSMRIQESGNPSGGGKGDYAVVTYQADVMGDMNGLIYYLDAIEKYPRFMTVSTFTLRAGEVSIDNKTAKVRYGLHSAKMEIMTYIYASSGKKGARQ